MSWSRTLSFLFAGWVSLSVIAPIFAQGTKADYDRANHLWERTRDKVYKMRVEPHWFAGNTRFWYRNDLPGKRREFVIVDAVKGTRSPAFDHGRVAASLSLILFAEVAEDRLPIDRLVMAEDGASFRFPCANRWWKFDTDAGTLTEDKAPTETPVAPRKPPGNLHQELPDARTDSPDGKWQTFVKEGNLYLRNTKTNEEEALSHEGTADDAYEPDVWWSPDGEKLVALRVRAGDERKVRMIESSPKDQLQPKMQVMDYLKPGDRVPVQKPHLFDLARRKEIRVTDELFSNPYDLREVRWEPDSRRFTFLYNQRGHQVLRVVAVDAITGRASPLIDDESPTFIDYAHKKFSWYVDATREVIWMSERDGWNHLYLFDAQTGDVKKQITKGEWVVRGVDRVDEKNRQIWFRAGGIRSDQSPYHVHYCRVNFDGTGLVVLTEGDGTHAIEYSPGRQFFIDTWSRVDLPNVTELRRSSDGKKICDLESADISELVGMGWKMPERMVAKGRDGKTDIYGVIFRPTNFDAGRKYRVIENIYAGPQDSHVPQAFRAHFQQQSMAELGFIVVQIDGMGTSNRSKAFHDVCWKNLADAGFPDRIPWLREAAHRYPCMDLSHGVGIYGGSAGGQNTLAGMLAYPDFYTVGVADCGCHDNRMDKIWWNELFMGWPVGPHYKAQSNATNAYKLKGKLLLIFGELDHNVDPSTTMQVVNALEKADKDFELLVMTGVGHGAAETPYGNRRRQDFFVRNLLGVEPRRE